MVHIHNKLYILNTNKIMEIFDKPLYKFFKKWFQIRVLILIIPFLIITNLYIKKKYEVVIKYEKLNMKNIKYIIIK